MRSSRSHSVLAVAIAAALVLPGCSMLAPPQPLKPAEMVGVDPTGETLDTSTLPPDEPFADDTPAAAAPAPAAPAARPEPAPQPPDATIAQAEPQSSAPAASNPLRTSSAGLVHHHRKRSHGDSGQ